MTDALLRYANLYSSTEGVLHRLVMLHRPVEVGNDHVRCTECVKDFPCTSFLFIEEDPK